MKKENVSNTYKMDYHSAFKKKMIWPFVTMEMNLEHIALSKIGQTQKDKFCTISLIYGILKSQTHRSQELNCSCQGLGGIWRNIGQKLQFYLCLMNKFWVFNVQHDGYS